MPWSSTTFSLLYDWPARRDAGDPTHFIGADEMQAQDQDLADGLEACVKANGDIAATANLPMGGFLHTGVGAATARTNYLRVTEFQDGGHVWVAGGGSADAITATYAPALTALTNGCHLRFRAASANATTTPTFAPNGLTAKTIVKGANAALVAGDIAGQHHECIVQYNSTTDKWHLLNPAYPLAVAASSIDLNGLTTDSTGGAVGDLIPFVDVSDSNASNKVTTSDLIKNLLANLTADATGGATGDKLIMSDASDSDNPNTVTVDNLLINGLQLLTTDATGGATGDFIAFADASESNAGNKVTVADLFYNAANNFTADTAPDMAADHVVTRDNSASAAKKVLLQYIGAGKQTVWVPAGAMVARTSSGAAPGTTESTTNKVMNKTLDFDTTTSEGAQFTVAFPKGWDEGTVTFIPYWTAASGSGTVIFTLAGVALSNDDAIDTAFGTSQSSTDTLLAALDIHVGPESSAITIAGTPAEGDIVYFQVTRDVSDTLGVDAKLIGIKLIYTTNVNTDN